MKIPTGQEYAAINYQHQRSFLLGVGIFNHIYVNCAFVLLVIGSVSMLVVFYVNSG